TPPDITAFQIEDNGIGFTLEHRESFDTLYSDHKIDVGGKGFGRFTALKYFKEVRYSSTFEENGIFRTRDFTMGLGNDIIVSEQVSLASTASGGTTVTLLGLQRSG